MKKTRRLPAMAALTAIALVLPAAIAQPATLEATSPAPATATVLSPAPSAEDVGDALMGHQRYEAAIEAYRKAPQTAAVLNKTGIAYQLMYNLQQASQCYRASLKKNPRDARVLNNLGTVYDAMKQYGNAEHMYRKALKMQPNSPVILKNLGSGLLARHKYKKGWEAYKEALALDPKVFENTASPRVENPASIHERGAMNYYMAKGCARAGQTDRAVEYLRMAINEGFTNSKQIIADSEFAGLRGVPAFERLLADQGNP